MKGVVAAVRKITEKSIQKYRTFLIAEEKSGATVEKYIYDIRAFAARLAGKELCRTHMLEYKKYLCARYAPRSVNSKLSSLNSFFSFCGWHDLKVKALKLQRSIFADSERELSKAEYERLLRAASARGNERLCLIMQAICASGLRVSELAAVTVDAARARRAEVRCKGKIRQIFLPDSLCRLLLKYARRRGIKSGAIFVTRSGKPLDRTNIWSDMKKLCESANVDQRKVFPHNLRHLFARTFYSVQKDIVRLADILGHSSVNTTRIYTMETGEKHRQQIQRLGLVMRM